MALFIIQHPLPPLLAFPVTSSRIPSFVLFFIFLFLLPTERTPKTEKDQDPKWNERHGRGREKGNLTKTIKADFFQADESSPS